MSHRKSTSIVRLCASLALLAKLCVLAAAPPPAASGATAASATDRVSNSVVKVFATVLRPDPARPWTKQAPAEVTGSGAIIDGDRILTAAHVVLYASQIEIQANRAGDKLLASVVAIAPSIDLAVLKVDDEAFFKEHRALARANSLPKITDAVYAYGFPTGGDTLAITKGIVSRIEFVDYGISSSGLRIQIDAALNPGNSGGPVVADDKMIGLAFGTVGNNIGYIIPNEEIALFLAQVAGGHTYHGKPSMYDELQTLENPALRRFLGLDKFVHGIVVHRPYRTDASYPLKEWDVITAIGDTKIDDQGMVTLGDDLRVRFQYLIQTTAKNNAVPLTIVRGAKTLNIELPLVVERPYMVKQLAGTYPEYFIYGPMVFSRAAIEHLQIYAPGLGASPRAMLGMFQSPLIKQIGLPPTPEREEVVIIASPFFPDKLTTGYDSPAGGTVTRINGQQVRSLKHLVTILRDMKDDYVTIEFDQPEREALVFSHAELADSTERILNNNGIRAQGSPDIMAIWQGH